MSGVLTMSQVTSTYQQHRHGSYTSPGITCDSRQLENAEAEKPLSAGCTWNVSGKAGVHNTDSYDVISTLASGDVKLSHQKPRCKATKPKHEPSRCLFIVHLSDSTTEDDLTTFAETYGTVDSTKVVRDPATQLCKGR